MIFGITGRRELGKTTLARYLAEARAPRIIVDPRAQWPATESTTQPYDAVDEVAMLQDLHDGIDVIIQPDDLQPSIDALAIVAKSYIQTSDHSSLTIVFDEAGLYHLRSWGWVMRCSPRERTSIILTAHRPQDISTDIRALMDRWCLFRTTQAHDLDAIEERCGARVAALVQSLDRFQFVEWNDALGEMRVHRDGRRWRAPDVLPLTGERDRRGDLLD